MCDEKNNPKIKYQETPEQKELRRLEEIERKKYKKKHGRWPEEDGITIMVFK